MIETAEIVLTNEGQFNVRLAPDNQTLYLEGDIKEGFIFFPLGLFMLGLGAWMIRTNPVSSKL